MHDYEGDLLHDERRRQQRRRNRQLDEELDDAWAAANEDDIPDHQVEIEDLASGYVEDPDKLEMDQRDEGDLPGADLGPLPPSARRLAQRRDIPRETRIRERYNRDNAYANSPSFHRSRQHPLDRAFSRLSGDDLIAQAQPHDPHPGRLGHFPFWGILLLVVLGIIALFVVALVMASILAIF
jgi:hypothetical protein